MRLHDVDMRLSKCDAEYKIKVRDATDRPVARSVFHQAIEKDLRGGSHARIIVVVPRARYHHQCKVHCNDTNIFSYISSL